MLSSIGLPVSKEIWNKSGLKIKMCHLRNRLVHFFYIYGMGFWVKTNRFVKWIFPNYIWDIPNNEKKVFLTFDDGPTPGITEWTLAQLKSHNAKATFFCIGNNIEKHPDIFLKVVQEGHSVGN